MRALRRQRTTATQDELWHLSGYRVNWVWSVNKRCHMKYLDMYVGHQEPVLGHAYWQYFTVSHVSNYMWNALGELCAQHNKIWSNNASTNGAPKPSCNQSIQTSHLPISSGHRTYIPLYYEIINDTCSKTIHVLKSVTDLQSSKTLHGIYESVEFINCCYDVINQRQCK